MIQEVKTLQKHEEKGRHDFFVLVLMSGYKLQLENHWFGEEVAEELVCDVISPNPEKEKEKRQPLTKSEKMWNPGQNLGLLQCDFCLSSESEEIRGVCFLLCFVNWLNPCVWSSWKFFSMN